MPYTINIHAHFPDHEDVQALLENVARDAIHFGVSYDNMPIDHDHDDQRPISYASDHIDHDLPVDQLLDLTNYVQSLADDAHERAQGEPTKQWWTIYTLLHDAAARTRGAAQQMREQLFPDEGPTHLADDLCTDPFCDVEHSTHDEPVVREWAELRDGHDQIERDELDERYANWLAEIVAGIGQIEPHKDCSIMRLENLISEAYDFGRVADQEAFEEISTEAMGVVRKRYSAAARSLVLRAYGLGRDYRGDAMTLAALQTSRREQAVQS